MAVTAPATTAPRVVMLAGASGSTGSALLRLLLDDPAFARVLALTRRPLPLEHPRLANRILQFGNLQQPLKGQRCTHALCALGAPGGARATEDALRAVDLALVIDFARAAMAAGATRLVVISAAGANPGAADAFLRVKGEMEARVRELGFASLDILQPRFVHGLRAEQGAADLLRLGAMATAGLMLQRSKYGAGILSCMALARAMHRAAQGAQRGVTTWSGNSLGNLAAVPRRSR